MQIIPVRAVANQFLTVQLSGQPTQLSIYQRPIPSGGASLYMDVSVNDALIIGGVLCLQGVAIVRTAYLGFIGDLAFFDTQPDPLNGPQDPDYSGIGARWPLYYFTPDELTNINEI
jgi:hypothetical protein